MRVQSSIKRENLRESKSISGDTGKLVVFKENY